MFKFSYSCTYLSDTYNWKFRQISWCWQFDIIPNMFRVHFNIYESEYGALIIKNRKVQTWYRRIIKWISIFNTISSNQCIKVLSLSRKNKINRNTIQLFTVGTAWDRAKTFELGTYFLHFPNEYIIAAYLSTVTRIRNVFPVRKVGI